MVKVKVARVLFRHNKKMYPLSKVEGFEVLRNVAPHRVLVIMQGSREELILEGEEAYDFIQMVHVPQRAAPRMSWSWLFHNLIGHPLMGILSFLGFQEAAERVHEATLPRSERKGAPRE